MLEKIIFYALMCSQIALFSYYFPRKLHARMRYVIEHYPPSKYPKLYPQDVELYHKYHRNYLRVNNLLLFAGIAILLVLILLQVDVVQEKFSLLPWAYFMLQFIPLLVLEKSEFNQIKQMREADIRGRRSAALTQKGFFDYIKIWEFAVAALFFIAACIISLILENPGFPEEITDVGVLITVLLTNVFFAGMNYWTLYVRKFDPYQALADREKIINVSLKSTIYTSIGMSIFVVITLSLDHYQMDYLMPIAMSLYCHAIALATLRMMVNDIAIEKMDFSVYQADKDVKVALQ